MTLVNAEEAGARRAAWRAGLGGSCCCCCGDPRERRAALPIGWRGGVGSRRSQTREKSHRSANSRGSSVCACVSKRGEEDREPGHACQRRGVSAGRGAGNSLKSLSSKRFGVPSTRAWVKFGPVWCRLGERRFVALLWWRWHCWASVKKVGNTLQSAETFRQLRRISFMWPGRVFFCLSRREPLPPILMLFWIFPLWNFLTREFCHRLTFARKRSDFLRVTRLCLFIFVIHILQRSSLGSCYICFFSVYVVFQF